MHRKVQSGLCLLALIAWGGTCPIQADSGRETEPLWSLQPVVPAPLPEPAGLDWCRTGIDRFVLTRLEAEGLAPNGEASRRQLIRRVTLDLHGLLPAPEEVRQFENDPSPNAWESLVDRLLASPRYGERWARHWLDVVRYTESQGFEYDHLRPNAWHYRDYVIDAFNSGKPYDRFVREQLAGDALPSSPPQEIIATSLLVCGPWDQAGSSQANVTQRTITREEELEDLVGTVAQGLLGMTVNCARCHAHKFDPIPQRDYYRIKSVFEGVRHGERPIAPPAEVEAQQKEKTRLDEEIKRLETLLAAGENPERAERGVWEARREELRRARSALPPLPTSYVGLRQQPPPTKVARRGDVNSLGETVSPGGLEAITALPSDFGLAPDAPEAERRAAFARWVTDPRNPLTSRVLVNRVWQYHFGRGLVATPSDFGRAGAGPSHPELLDWLAARFVQSGWDLKTLHRLILSSSVYRQSSQFNSKAALQDADNRWLWRFAPRRLEAETIRDVILAASGSMNWRMGGPSFRPFEVSNFGSSSYTPQDRFGPEFDRRTIYRMNINSGKDPLLDALDCPDPSVKTPRRNVTITPLQALSLMNNPFVVREAQNLARRIGGHHGGDHAAVERSVPELFERLLGRPPAPTELEPLLAAARDRGLWPVGWVLFNSTEFLYVQ